MTMFNNAIDRMKDCPFCGLHDLRMNTGEDSHWWYIVCNDCGATGPADLGESGAIESWDYRDYEEE